MAQTLASAFEAVDELRQRLAGRALVLFLDYDGTLTPIVEHPALAVLDEATRSLVESLSRRCVVAIISGRDLDDVRKHVGLDRVFYAGSHGFEFAGPGGWTSRYEGAEAFLGALDAAERELREGIAGVPGAWVERKRFAIAVHYRQAADDDVPSVEAVVDAALGRHGELRKGTGKKVFELRPRADWDKGRAVLWLLRSLGLQGGASVSVYLGDDVTDEDAFRAVAEQGIGVLVADTPRPTAARYVLRSPDEVRDFLRLLGSILD